MRWGSLAQILPHKRAHRHSDNSLGWQEKSQSGTEHATLIFIDFILTPKKATHGNLTDAVPDPQTPPLGSKIRKLNAL